MSNDRQLKLAICPPRYCARWLPCGTTHATLVASFHHTWDHLVDDVFDSCQITSLAPALALALALTLTTPSFPTPDAHATGQDRVTHIASSTTLILLSLALPPDQFR